MELRCHTLVCAHSKVGHKKHCRMQATCNHGTARYCDIDDNTPSSKFLKAISNPKLSRVAASRIAQFRLTHAPLNSYLKRIGRVDSARCPACGEDEESIEHFLLRCPNYAHKRWPLLQHARKKRKALSLKISLGDPQFMILLAVYIQATGRFPKPGEHSTTQSVNTVR